MLRLIFAGTVAIALFAAALPAATGAAGPKRIVSLYLCADELLLQLADRPAIASVTFLSRDPDNSNVADLAARVPVNYGRAEEIIAQRPDLVVAGAYTTGATVAMLKRAGVPVVELGVAQGLDDVRRDIRTVAHAIGEDDRGEALIAAVDAHLAALAASPPRPRLRALVLNPNGFTIGAGSLVDEIFARAGFDNVAATLGVDAYGQLPLERIVRSDADVLILNADRDGPPSLATQSLDHPALRKLAGRVRVVVLPARLWTCGGPGIVEAIERLRRVADQAHLAGVPQ
jgi:iron complex transport system substrate-binding protein